MENGDILIIVCKHTSTGSTFLCCDFYSVPYLHPMKFIGVCFYDDYVLLGRVFVDQTFSVNYMDYIPLLF